MSLFSQELIFLAADDDLARALAVAESRFPTHAVEVLDKLRDRAERRAAEQRIDQEEYQRIRRELQEERRDLAHRELEKAGPSDWQKSDEEELRLCKERVERLRAKLIALDKIPKTELPEHEKPLRATVEELNGASLLHWIASQSNPKAHVRTFVEKRGTAPKGDLEKALARTESALFDVATEFKNVRTAAPKLDEQIAQLRADIRAKAKHGAPDVSPLARCRYNPTLKRFESGRTAWPEEQIWSTSGQSIKGELGLSALCWLFENEIFEKLKADLHTKFEGRTGLTVGDRKQREAELRKTWISTQRELVTIREKLRLPHVVAHPLATLGIDFGPTRERIIQNMSAEGVGGAMSGTPIAEALEAAKNLPDIRRGRLVKKGK